MLMIMFKRIDNKKKRNDYNDLYKYCLNEFKKFIDLMMISLFETRMI